MRRPRGLEQALVEACARQVDEVAEEESGTAVAASTEEREAAQQLVECAGQEMARVSGADEDALEGEPGVNEAGNGAGDEGDGVPAPADPATTPAELDPAARALFASTCGACHALSDAETTGAVGPNLDETDYDAARVAEQIERGGGGMPPHLLEGQEQQAVAEYVAAAAARSGT